MLEGCSSLRKMYIQPFVCLLFVDVRLFSVHSYANIICTPFS